MKFFKSVLCVVPIFLSSCGSSTTQQKQETTYSQPSSEVSTMAKIKLPSGLQYEILKAASENEKAPTVGQPVVVHYTGWLEQNGVPGQKFDSSLDRGQPFVFLIGVGQVIKGWDEGVASMKVGEKRRLFIPADLGYGTRGAGAVIPPNANLIFDVELMGVA